MPVRMRQRPAVRRRQTDHSRKGVDDGVSGAVEGGADVVRYDVAEIAARDSPAMNDKRHPPGDARFKDAQSGE